MTPRKQQQETTTPLKAADDTGASSADETLPREARVDKSYVERSYKDAMTKEQRETLKEEGLL